MARKRLLKGIAESGFPEGDAYDIEVVAGDDVFKWEVRFTGLPDSPLEGCPYALIVSFPPDYPFNPPLVASNEVSDCGYSPCSCHDIMRNGVWSPSITMRSLIPRYVRCYCFPGAGGGSHAAVELCSPAHRRMRRWAREQTMKPFVDVPDGDIVVAAGDCRFRVHQWQLAAHSRFFRTMLDDLKSSSAGGNGPVYDAPALRAQCALYLEARAPFRPWELHEIGTEFGLERVAKAAEGKAELEPVVRTRAENRKMGIEYCGPPMPEGTPPYLRG